MKKFFFVFALAACGGGGGGGFDTVGEAFEASNERGCAKAFDCMAEFPEEEFGVTFEEVFGATEAECIESGAADPAEIAEVEDSIDAGRVIFDGEDAATCFDQQSAQSCDVFWDLEAPPPAACETIFTGTVADGGTCTIDIDCEGEESFCDEETLVCGPL